MPIGNVGCALLERLFQEAEKNLRAEENRLDEQLERLAKAQKAYQEAHRLLSVARTTNGIMR